MADNSRTKPDSPIQCAPAWMAAIHNEQVSRGLSGAQPVTAFIPDADALDESYGKLEWKKGPAPKA